MSNLVQIMLALFGAAFLGSVIGWCARRIVALKDERYMRSYHEKHSEENEVKIANLNQQLIIGEKKIEQLQSEVNEIDMLDATMAATDIELEDVRREQTLQEQQIRQRDDEIRQMREEINTYRLVARNATSENRKLLDRIGSLGYGDSTSIDSVSSDQSAQFNQSEFSQPPSHGNSRQGISNRSISIDMKSDVEDVDSDIADLTADLSSFLPIQENDRDTSGPNHQAATSLAQNSDDTPDSSGQESSSEIRSSSDRTEQTDSQEAEPKPNDKNRNRSGLFSSFNRRNKR